MVRFPDVVGANLIVIDGKGDKITLTLITIEGQNDKSIIQRQQTT